MIGVTIREAASGDVPAILRIAERGWHVAYGGFLSQETIDTAMTEWYDPDATREQIEREDVAYFVAEQNGDVLGYASGGPSGEETTAILGAIYVDPDRWEEGIGTALLDEFEAFCRRQGYETIRVQMLAENDIGASFYRNHGYEVVEERATDLFGETVRECEFRGQVGSDDSSGQS